MPDQPTHTIAIKRFFTKYERDPDNPGQMRGVDWVEYGPPGGLDRTTVIDKVSRIAKVHDLADARDNPAVQLANLRWDVIRPLYENWKKGLTPTADGTPLAAWNRLSSEQADHLRIQGVGTIEQLSTLGDAHVQRLQIPGLRDLIEDARRFLRAGDTARVEMELRAKDEQMAAMADELAEMREQMQALAQAQIARDEGDDVDADEAQRPRRGRPPKVRDEAA